MNSNSSAKNASTKAPQMANMETSAEVDSALSPVERYLGLIKALAIIMAVLILAALSVVVVTIYGRLTVKETAKTIQEHNLMIPVDSRVTSASLSEKGQLLLIIEGKTGQQLWQVDSVGKVRHKIRVIQSP